MFTYFRHNIHEFYNVEWNRKSLLREKSLHKYNYKKGCVNKMLAIKQLLQEQNAHRIPSR